MEVLIALIFFFHEKQKWTLTQWVTTGFTIWIKYFSHWVLQAYKGKIAILPLENPALLWKLTALRVNSTEHSNSQHNHFYTERNVKVISLCLKQILLGYCWVNSSNESLDLLKKWTPNQVVKSSRENEFKWTLAPLCLILGKSSSWLTWV